MIRSRCSMGLLGAMVTWASAAQFAVAQSPPDPVIRPLIEHDVILSTGSDRADVSSGAPRGAGFCPGPFTATHTTTPFDVAGTSVIAQGGFLEGEWAATTYVIPADHFPIILETSEILLASPSVTASSQTEYTFAAWQGTPATGTLVEQVSSNGIDIPHAQHPVGQNVALRVQVQVDPGGPDQIIINNDGSNSFSIGFRIDAHNMQLFGTCGIACNEPLGLLCTGSNMMPSTDTDGQAQPTNNWLFAINCPGLSAGWYNFSQLSGLGLSLSGDWMIQASYRCINAASGACCLTTSCVEQTADACDALSGIFQGSGTICANVICPVVGACCKEDGTCSLEESTNNCSFVGGIYQGDGVPCDPTPCPQPGACCFPGDSCIDLIEATCNDIGADFRGVGTACVNGFCPIGPCCLPDGTCQESLGQDECTSLGGAYQGDSLFCFQVTCPQPIGACCVASSDTCIGGLTEANCMIIPTATWAGPQTACPAACNTDPCEGVALGDFDANTTVDGIDLSLFSAALVSGSPSQSDICTGDFDDNDQLDTNDIPGMVAALLQ